MRYRIPAAVLLYVAGLGEATGQHNPLPLGRKAHAGPRRAFGLRGSLARPGHRQPTNVRLRHVRAGPGDLPPRVWPSRPVDPSTKRVLPPQPRFADGPPRGPGGPRRPPRHHRRAAGLRRLVDYSSRGAAGAGLAQLLATGSKALVRAPMPPPYAGQPCLAQLYDWQEYRRYGEKAIPLDQYLTVAQQQGVRLYGLAAGRAVVVRYRPARLK